MVLNWFTCTHKSSDLAGLKVLFILLMRLGNSDAWAFFDILGTRMGFSYFVMSLNEFSFLDSRQDRHNGLQNVAAVLVLNRTG